MTKNNGDGDNQEPGNAPPTGDAPGQQSGEGVTFTPEQQAALDKIVGERLGRAKEKWESTAETAREKAKDAAETARLTEQQEFKTLADKANARVLELEPLAAQVEVYSETFTKMLEARRKGLPPHIVTLLDAVGDPLKQLTWLEENADKLALPAAPDIDGKKKGTGTKADIEEAQLLSIKRRFNP